MAPLADKDCRVREVECRSILNKSGLADYAVNCYAGCEHGCIYCYARFATMFSHPSELWGSFVDVKVFVVLFPFSRRGEVSLTIIFCHFPTLSPIGLVATE